VSSLISSGKTVAYTTAYYDSTSANYLVNGYSTWDNWKIGFYQTAWFIRIDLGENYTLDYCRFCWSQWIAAGVLAPSSIKVFVGTATSAYSTAHIMTTFSTEDILHNTVWSSNAPLTGNNRYVEIAGPTPGSGKINTFMEFEIYGDPVVAPTTVAINYLKGRRNRWDFSGVSAG